MPLSAVAGRVAAVSGRRATYFSASRSVGSSVRSSIVMPQCRGVAAPWSWELTSGENPAYPRQDAGCYQIGGSAGSLAIPQMDVWSYPGKRGWWEPLARERIAVAPADPLPLQIRHFCDVIRGRAAPFVPAREGLAALRVIAAIKEAARTGGMVAVG